MLTQLIQANARIGLRRTKVALLVLGLAWFAGARAAGPQISVRLEPQQIALDQAAELTVTAPGEESEAPTLPAIPGLQMTPMGESSSYQSINGVVTSSTTHSYQVTASREGSYSITPIKVAGTTAEPVVLQVRPAGSVQNGAPQARTDVVPAGIGGRAFLRVVVPKRQLYVGESVPIRIEAFIQQGVGANLDGPPTLSSDAFSVSKLSDNPQQLEQVVGGTAYTVLTWSSALETVKAGTYSLNLELPLTLRLAAQSTNRDWQDQFRSFFGISWANLALINADIDRLLGQVVERQRTLRSADTRLTVLPLPVIDRPADFSGAVGHFEVNGAHTPASVAAGDPLTLKFTVSGDGSFDRVNTLGLSASPSWRAYRPEARFESADSLNLHGRKIFEQAVVPLQPGPLQLPAMAFSYFDPDLRHYVTRRTQPISLEVAAAAASAAPTVPLTQSVSGSGPTPPTTPGGLFPNAISPGAFVSTLQPLISRPWFLALSGTPMLLLAGALWWVRRRDTSGKNPNDHGRGSHLDVVRANLRLMDGALEREDAAAFFVGARDALQEQLASIWHTPVAAVDEARIHQQLGRAGEAICSIFRQAETAAYAGEVMSREELERWQPIIRQELRTLEGA